MDEFPLSINCPGFGSMEFPGDTTYHTLTFSQDGRSLIMDGEDTGYTAVRRGVKSFEASMTIQEEGITMTMSGVVYFTTRTSFVVNVFGETNIDGTICYLNLSAVGKRDRSAGDAADADEVEEEPMSDEMREFQRQLFGD